MLRLMLAASLATSATCIVQHTCISVRNGTHTIHYEYTYEYLTRSMQTSSKSNHKANENY
jgi:hypothetical protein